MGVIKKNVTVITDDDYNGYVLTVYSRRQMYSLGKCPFKFLKTDAACMKRKSLLPALTYLPHIDGLRAVAVLSVLFFHVDIHLFSGGFVGVDIFFVISGYLITYNILSTIDNNDFTFKNFYHRRIRRLFPALIATVATTFIFGIIIFPADHLERLANASIFSLLSLSNIFFWSESGYFDVDASIKPLLHVWSLSVEEQFYLFWPFFLSFLRRKRGLFFWMISLSLLSLIMCEYVMGKDASLVFFLTPFRIVEFAMGGILVFLTTHPLKQKWISEMISLSGLIFLFIAIFGFSEKTRFPGVSALLPCVGAAALIYSGKASISGFILRNRLMVGLGLISYSLYLVHWPVIVFYKYRKMVPLNDMDRGLLLTATCILAILMYFIIEKPFRSGKNTYYKIPSKVFFTVMGMSTFFVLLTATHASYDDGWQWRFNRLQFTQSDIDQGMEKRLKIIHALCNKRGWDHCFDPSDDKNKNILVIGDSHGMDGLNIFYQAYPDFHYTILELGGCPPMIPEDTGLLAPNHPDREKCIQLNIDRFNRIKQENYAAILISILFEWYKPEHLMHAINQIKRDNNVKVIVLGNFIHLNRDFTDIFNQNVSIDGHPELVKHFALYEDELRAIAPGNFLYISKTELLCNSDTIDSCKLWFDDVPFTYDQHHLSYEASGYIAKRLKEKYGDILLSR